MGVICFLGGYSLLNFVLMPHWVGHGKEVTVPDLQNKSLAQAEALLRDAGLFYAVVGEQYDSRVPSGYVLIQDPVAGMMTKPGRQVLLTLSKGEERVSVPSLVGLPFDERGAPGAFGTQSGKNRNRLLGLGSSRSGSHD